MPYSEAEITATELARYNADLPLLCHSNAARSVNAAPQWRTSGSWASGSDVTATGYPTTRAYDDVGHRQTRPSSGATTHYLIWDLDDVTFDGVVIHGHNFASLGGTVTVAVEIADNSSFSTNLLEIASFSGTAVNYRMASFALVGAGTNNARFSSVQYLRLVIGYNGSAPHPAIGELYLTTREALEFRPEPPHDSRSVESDFATAEFDSGADHTQRGCGGRMVSGPSWRPTDSTMEDQFRDFFAGCGYGRLCGLWVPNPNTTPAYSYVVRTEPAMYIPGESGEARAMLTLPMVEQKPFSAREIYP